MSDELNQLLQSHSKEIFATIAGLVGTIWLMVRAAAKRIFDRHDKLEDRVNKLEEEKADREELNKAVASLRAEIHVSKTEIKEELKEHSKDMQTRMESMKGDVNSRFDQGIKSLEMLLAAMNK